ncbi:MAG: GLUG motif-containing protein, partial [Prevotella sp.]
NSSVTALPPHTLDSNGFCTRCGGFQMAEKVSSTHHPELKSTHNGYYAIENAGQLYWLAALVNGELDYMPQNRAANAVLTSKITVNEGVLTSDGSLSPNSGNFRRLKMIGSGGERDASIFYETCKYDGIFDGNGKTISGLYFKNEEWYIALFGDISPNGKIKNVGLTDCYIDGTRYIAGICIHNYGSIENCYVTGVIKGILDVGGICYYNVKTLKNCYVAGYVKGEESTAAIVAYNDESGNVTNCYYLDTTTSNAFAGNRGTATNVESKTLAQFKSGEVAYLLQGDMAKHVWGQAIGTDDYPVIGGPKVNYGYTCTDTELGYKNEICFETPGHKYDNGFCPRCHGYQPAEKVSATHHPELNATHNGYYAIENGGQLYWLAGVVNGTIDGTNQNVAANAVLANNITVNNNVLKADGSLSDDASTFRVWNPIGYYADEAQSSSEPSFYVGTFDGNCKTISGLYYNRRVADAEFIGLFGAVGEQGSITNVGVVDSYFNAYAVTGGICGYLAGGTIRNCYNSATVKGTPVSSGDTDFTIGGVCGGLYLGTISNCYNNGAVSGTTNVGAVCGAIEESSPFTFANCYYDNEKCSVKGINNSDALGLTFGKSTAQFGSGEVSYLLSKGYNGSIWGQKLGTDAYPILGGAKVYYGYAPDDCQHISYSNTTRTETPNHTYDNGFCTICDGYQPAIK